MARGCAAGFASCLLVPCWFQRADPEELSVHARRRVRPWYLTFLGTVVTASTMAATALAGPGPWVVALAADTGPCGSTGVLTNATTCTYTTIGSDTFTVPAGVNSVVVDVVGAQGGRYFIAGDAAHGGSPAGDIQSSSLPGRGGVGARRRGR
jgi:hypothetical protein